MISNQVSLAYKHIEGDYTVLGIYDDIRRANRAITKLKEDFPDTHFELLNHSLSWVAWTSRGLPAPFALYSIRCYDYYNKRKPFIPPLASN